MAIAGLALAATDVVKYRTRDDLPIPATPCTRHVRDVPPWTMPQSRSSAAISVSRPTMSAWRSA